jgi:putative ABC transport system permease protein
MLPHSNKILARNLQAKPLYSIVNILGISLAVLASGLVYTFVRHELSYDKFHKNRSQIYRVDSYFHMPILERPDFTIPSISSPLSDMIRSELPGIAHSTRFMASFGSELIVKFGTDAFVEKLTFVDNDFFKIFSFAVIKGNSTSPFLDHSSIVVTESIVKKYFGNEDPIGKLLTVVENDEQANYIVSGVVSDPPQNSSINFQLLVPIESWRSYNDVADLWNEHNYSFFVELRPETDSSNFQTGLNRIIQNVHKFIINEKNTYRVKLSPISQMHWNTQVPWNKTSDLQNIKILVAMILVVIAIACVNFITLSIVNSSTRTTEIGIKKILGAQRTGVMLQFLYESFILTVLGTIVGLFLIALLIPQLDFMDGISLDKQFDSIDILFLGGLIFFVSNLSGSYPAILLSKYNPSQILRGGGVVKTKTSIVFFLVAFQFALSLFLTCCSFVMTGQMTYINQRDLGFDHEHVIVLPTFATDEEARSVVSRFKTEASKEPFIVGVSACSNPFFGKVSRMGLGGGGSARVFNVDSDFLKTMGIKLEEGRDFNSQNPADSLAVIVNRELALGLGDKPVGQVLEWGLEQSSEIIGITEDFNYESLEFPINPLFITMSKTMRPPSTLLIKIRSENIGNALQRIEALFKTTNPGKPFQFTFLSESVNRLYSSYRMWTNIINWANIFVSFIACVGLFGLAGVDIGNKYKEIGIRKAFGATAQQILYRIARRYFFLIGIAAVISIPLSNHIMTNWISKFAYRIDITWQVYAWVILFGLIAIVVAVSYHVLKGASLNPAKTLKHNN